MPGNGQPFRQTKILAVSWSGETAVRSMSARFPKSVRVLTSRDFQRAHESSLFAADATLVIKGVRNGLQRTRLGLSVSRHTGNAVARNRWKRLVREAFRTRQGSLATGWDLVVRPRKGAVADFVQVASSLVSLARRIDRAASRKSNAGKSGREHDDG